MDRSALLYIAFLAMSVAVVGFVILQSITRNRSRSAGEQSLLVFVGLYAVLKLDELFIVTGAYFSMPHVAGLLAPLRTLIAPAFFIYVRATTMPAAPLFRPSDLWAAVGPAGFLLLMSWYFVLPAPAKQDLLSLSFSDPELRELAFTMCRFLFAWFFVFSSLYIFLCLRRLRSYAQDVKAVFSNVEHRTLNWLVNAAFILLGMMAWYAAGELWAFTGTRPAWFRDMTAFLELAAVGIFCVCAVNQPPVCTDAFLSGDKPASNRWSLSDSDLARLAATLQNCMQTHQLYLRNDLALKDLASAVKRSEDHVSQALRHLSTNFYAFVNDYRIQEARRLLRESDISVLDIAFEVGFNTKSTFNASFKRITGQTPSAFRDAHMRSTGLKKAVEAYESGELDERPRVTR